MLHSIYIAAKTKKIQQNVYSNFQKIPNFNKLVHGSPYKHSTLEIGNNVWYLNKDVKFLDFLFG